MKFRKVYLSFILPLLGNFLLAQTRTDNSLYSTFDNAIGLKNLGINNGTVHLDPFRRYDMSHRYYVTDKYVLGNVIYDGQPYSNENVKYDLFKDVLVVKVNAQNNSVGINLIPEKTESFNFNGKEFVNLDRTPNAPNFIKGFYELYRGEKMNLYIKYHKDQIDILTVDGVFYKYELSTEFFVSYNNTFYKLKNDYNLSDLLPTYENKIEEFSRMSHDLQKTDRIQYMKDMIKYVNNFLQAETK